MPHSICAQDQNCDMTKFTAPAQAASMKLDRVEFMILSLGVLSLAALFSAAMALM